MVTSYHTVVVTIVTSNCVCSAAAVNRAQTSSANSSPRQAPYAQRTANPRSQGLSSIGQQLDSDRRQRQQPATANFAQSVQGNMVSMS